VKKNYEIGQYLSELSKNKSVSFLWPTVYIGLLYMLSYIDLEILHH